MTNKLLPVTVKRELWWRGNGAKYSKLLRPYDRNMCCLGFACLAAGLTEDDIKDLSYPHEVVGYRLIEAPALAKLTDGNTSSDICRLISMTNDEDCLSPEEREAQLTDYGLEAGIAFTFVD